MNDERIRSELKVQFLSRIQGECLIVDELGLLRGSSIADLAFISPYSFEGFEIKSGEDNLWRLPRQVQFYNKIFDFNTVITESKYVNDVIEIVYPNWGILIAEATIAGVSFRYHKHPEQNINVDKRKMLELLWRNECIFALQKLKIKNVSSLDRDKLCDKLNEQLSTEQVRRIIYDAMTKRKGWKTSTANQPSSITTDRD